VSLVGRVSIAPGQLIGVVPPNLPIEQFLSQVYERPAGVVEDRRAGDVVVLLRLSRR
jgi:hypothetical protein